MPGYTVRVTGYDDDGAPCASVFTVEGRDRADAHNEALAAARDCGWQECSIGRIEEQRPTASERIRTARDDHSASRRVDVLREEAPHLIAPDDAAIAARLEELRAVLRAENISYGELAELQSLAEHIEPGDVELLEAAGVPEHGDDCRTILVHINVEVPNDSPATADSIADEIRAAIEIATDDSAATENMPGVTSGAWCIPLAEEI